MPADGIRVEDSQMDFSGGVNSNVVTTVQSPRVPNGLKRTQLAWLVNGTVRSGAVGPRSGWNYLCTVHDASAQYQGGWMYDATPVGGFPYLMLSIGGKMLQVRVDTDNSVVDVTAGNDDPADVPQAWFTQGERFMIKQPGDFGLVPHPLPPLFWDGTSLRRSNGQTGNPTDPNISELPPATCMTYYMGRIWYAQDRVYCAGDIVYSPSGTLAYNFTDAILKTTQNPLALGGNGFAVPAPAGNIRALNYPIQLDTTLGEGPLFVFTRGQIYAITVPVSVTDWIAADFTNQPLQRVLMNGAGTVSDRSVVSVNGDLWFQTVTPSIASYFMSLRYFGQWSNSPLANNMNRILSQQDRGLMRVCSGVTFANRMFQTVMPVQTAVGIASQAIAVLDFDPISSLDNQNPPAWEGSYEGLLWLQLFTGDFGGRQRMFAVILSKLTNDIEVWEFTDGQLSDTNRSGESRVEWILEHPALTAGDENQFKRLDNGELWFDLISGIVDVTVQFRMDGDQCWHDWTRFRMCSARNSAESGDFEALDSGTPDVYPVLEFCAQDRRPVVLPKAPAFDCNAQNKRPVNMGYQAQVKLSIKGYCRLRSLRLFFEPVERQHYAGIIC